MTDPASVHITAAALIGLWGFIAGFGLCLWLVQRAERIKDRTKAEAKP